MQTEFTELDNYININEPKLILLGGIKGAGKTTFLANIAANLSLHQNIPILFSVTRTAPSSTVSNTCPPR